MANFAAAHVDGLVCPAGRPGFIQRPRTEATVKSQGAPGWDVSAVGLEAGRLGATGRRSRWQPA